MTKTKTTYLQLIKIRRHSSIDVVMTSEQIYRPSASLILAARQRETSSDSYDYKLLLIKRSSLTSYAEDHCVFPGGVFDANTDESIEWLTYLRSFGVTDAQLEQLTVSSKKRPAPLMTNGQYFSRDISLRLTAIRELFEEVGLLLCRERKTSFESLCPNSKYAAKLYTGNNFDRVHWQKTVHNDAYQFMELCKQLDVIPDLWALSEWSIWRSPATANKKYDTVYYFAALAEQPLTLLPEPSEVELGMWLNPSQCLKLFNAEVIWLPFLLYYEISRLTHVRHWLALAAFAQVRGQHGSTQLTPVYYRCDDVMWLSLPGDSFYPQNPENYTETIVLRGNFAALRRKRNNKIHRIVIYGLHDVLVQSNIPNFDEHLSPLLLTDSKMSKL